MTTSKSKVGMAILVAALGYFVDIYDLLLFSIVRIPSLHALGVTGDAVIEQGVRLINMQMSGMLVGGILWGILGDKRGRLSVLFGSILMYSTANFLNSWVTTIDQYAVLRFIAGIGLAGELGAGITLVSELLPKASRGYGTTLVAAFGISGAVLGGWVAEHTDWRTAYQIGGAMGLGLLLLRVGVFESGLFQQLEAQKHVVRGSLKLLLSSAQRAKLYVACILIGVPIWFVIGILVTFAPEFGKAFGIEGTIQSSRAVMYAYAGLALGDLASGLLSQWFKSRKRAVKVFLVFTAIQAAIYLGLDSLCAWFGIPLTPEILYIACGFVGFSVGYWAMFVTIAAEQFGTNLRATVATSVPNFVRGSVVLLTSVFLWLRPESGIKGAALFVGVVSIGIAFFALTQIRETFGRDLDFLETL